MQVKDLSHPKNSVVLNENTAKQFGYKLNISEFNDAQLRSARDSLTNKIAAFESNNSYDEIYENNEYQKNRAFLDVITHAISERTLSPGEEKKAEKYVKGMKKVKGDFSKRYGKRGPEVMYATATKMAKESTTDGAMKILRYALTEQVLSEGEEDKAAIIMSSSDMVDKLTGWLEDVASLKAESFLELEDSIRRELGAEMTQRYTEVAKPALESLYTSLESSRQTLTHALSILTGEEGPSMGGTGSEALPEQPGLPGETAPAQELPDMEDEFAGAGAAAGGTMDTGRMKRESIEYSRKLGTILSSQKKN